MSSVVQNQSEAQVPFLNLKRSQKSQSLEGSLKMLGTLFNYCAKFLRNFLQFFKWKPAMAIESGFGVVSNDAAENNTGKIVPLSVNFHFTRKCNYSCGFCFHTAKTSYLAPLEDAKIGLKMLQVEGMKKINFSGGEPFLYADHLGKMCKFCKEDLQLESVSIVSNGSKIEERFFDRYGKYVDIIAISVDSFDEATNVKIGRGRGKHLAKLNDISHWCGEHKIKFRLNTVVNRFNHEENFEESIQMLEPFRWKCFQVLPVETENTGNGTERDCRKFIISDEEFDAFCKRHEQLPCFVPESNRMMKSSYLILDEYLRFLNKGDNYRESKSILEISVQEALQGTDYEEDIFFARGGVYEWVGLNGGGGGCSSADNPLLDF